ncbi:hypothetical protein B0T09DRAFT_274100 [Sordaria sp. MPI-SDFR-AT-0083]|nr:hypothetical protein B0T09DRAFT_274100 [Sordaria sp. MPI-SDFR-AT-0083]
MATAVEVVSTEHPDVVRQLDSKSPTIEVKETSVDFLSPVKGKEAGDTIDGEVKPIATTDKPEAKDGSTDVKKDDAEVKELADQKSGDGDGKENEEKKTEEEDKDIYAPESENLTLGDLVPEYRCVTFKQFKNFYENEDMTNIIYALKGPSSLHSQIQKEKQHRENSQKIAWRTRHLYRAAGEDSDLSLPMRPQTFCRPFRLLIHYHSEMKKALDELEGRWGVSPGVVEDAAAGGDAKPKDSDNSDTKASKNYLDSKEALLHMREYIQFLEREVMSASVRLERAVPRVEQSSKVTFTDLWYLYREGDIVYSPVPTGKGRSSANVSTNSSSSDLEASYQTYTCWIVYAVITPETPIDPDSLEVKQPGDDDGMGRSDADAYDEERTTRICCYYLDFDGDSYGPVTHQFLIRSFSGERDVTTLPVYPTHFMSLDQETRFLKERSENGLKFAEVIRIKHLYHRGWTLTRSPVDAVLDDNTKYPEHIESEVIVDFNEAFQSFPWWEPEFHVLKMVQEASWRYDSCDAESISAQRWNKPRKDNMHACIVLHRSDNIAHIRRNNYLENYLENDPFLTALRNGAHESDAIPSGRYLQLLPRRLVVFALLERKFVNACVTSLGRITLQNGIFDKLSIDPRNKSMVRSLVQEHFRKKAHRDRGKEVVYQDLVRGKGVQEALFAITCGDLGFEPGTVEKSLTRIFRLANRWDCILLLDEAKIFFTKRSPSDLQRNALVSVFLRILEYYGGILFLTTNRVGTLDEAFKSRTHVSLKYPPLSKEQYEAVFRVNIEKIKEIEGKSEGRGRLVIDEEDILSWARNHYETNKEYVGRWNGRQIRNAFLIGSSLAHYDMSEGAIREMAIPNKRHGILDGAPFEAVAVTRTFDLDPNPAARGSQSRTAEPLEPFKMLQATRPTRSESLFDR